jgi:regulatory protein
MRRRPFEDDRPAPPPGSSRLAALRLLGRRDYSIAELTSRLLDRGHDPAEVELVIVALRGEGLLDDDRVARAHARTASTIKGRGRHRIRREIEARGIDRHVAELATAGLSGDEEAATLRRLIERKTRGQVLDAASRQRLFQQLLRRGFSAAAIGAALAGVRS